MDFLDPLTSKIARCYFVLLFVEHIYLIFIFYRRQSYSHKTKTFSFVLKMPTSESKKKQLQINVSEDVVSLKNDTQICVCVEDIQRGRCRSYIFTF